MTLCAESDGRGAGDHHLLVGHFGDYGSMNLRARHEAAHEFHGMTALQLRASAIWQKLARGKPQHLGDMDARARKKLRAAMDAVLPRPKRA